MKKTIKILLITLMLLSVFCVNVNAASKKQTTSSSGVSPSGYSGDSNYNVSSVETIGNQIIKIVSTVGSIASVIVLVVLGLKYMMGSAEEKAEYKKTLLPYVIGAALVFAASTIATVVFNFTSSLG